jgi:hypothetical protein
VLLKNKDISKAASAIQPAANGIASYCQVNITVSDLEGPKDGYLPGQKQMNMIGIALPLNSADGGGGGVQGNWNGRIEDVGGGGFNGSVGIAPYAPVTNSGYVGSSTDTGHESTVGTSDGSFALNPNGTLNWGLIRDFAFNGIHEQAVWTKNVTRLYYNMDPKYTYWNGCSTGGRQAHQQAQTYPDDFDGILGGDPAINWDRFVAAELWPQVVMKQEVGAPISADKLNAVTQAAINACDALDGITDGIVQDPRACTYSAKQFVCSGSVSDSANCLTPQEAVAVNKIWDGPPGLNRGSRLWFGLERGTPLPRGPFGTAPVDGLAGQVPFNLALSYYQYWIFQNPAFDWHTLTESTFTRAFLESELKFNQVIGTDDPNLSKFRKRGGKMILYHGLNDEVIFPRGSYNYYNRVTAAMGGISETQKFYRFFPYPGNNHCGFAITSPNAPLINTTDLFNALINWVEHGVAPDSIVAYNSANPTTATVSRPICKYPDKLVFKGGSTSVASNFFCQHQDHDDFLVTDLVVPVLGADQGRDDDNGHAANDQH